MCILLNQPLNKIYVLDINLTSDLNEGLIAKILKPQYYSSSMMVFSKTLYQLQLNQLHASIVRSMVGFQCILYIVQLYIAMVCQGKDFYSNQSKQLLSKVGSKGHSIFMLSLLVNVLENHRRVSNCQVSMVVSLVSRSTRRVF